MITIPQRPDPAGWGSVRQLAERFYRFCSQAIDYMAAQPTFELRAIESDGHYPIQLDTVVDRPAGIVCVQARDKLTGETIAAGAVAWRMGESVDGEGVLVDLIEGVPAQVGTRGDTIELTLLIVGDKSL